MSAVFSPCRTWRYSLTRNLPPQLEDGQGYSQTICTFVMLNPSTADAEHDDPTIRRCIRFARDWGYTRLDVVNLYAYRTRSPHVMWEEQARGTDIVGPENDAAMSLAFSAADVVIAAWGAEAGADRVAQFAETFAGQEMYALGLTKSGQPRHPLYMRADVHPFAFGLA